MKATSDQKQHTFMRLINHWINKSHRPNISRISNQFRKIELWLTRSKQPSDIVISRNIIIKYPSLLHLESFTKVWKFPKTCNYNFIQLIGLNSKIFKESIRARRNSSCLYFPHIVPRLQGCVKRLAKTILYYTFLRPLLLTPSVFFFFFC